MTFGRPSKVSTNLKRYAALALAGCLFAGADSAHGQDDAPGITYGGELPTPVGEPDELPDAKAGSVFDAPSQDDSADAATDTDDTLRASDSGEQADDSTPEFDQLVQSIDRLSRLIRGLPSSVNRADEWQFTVNQVAQDVRDLADQNDQQSVETIRAMSQSLRLLERSIRDVMSQGMPTDQFNAVRQLRDVLTGEVYAALAPWEQGAGITPESWSPSTNGRVVGRAPIESGGDRVIARPVMPVPEAMIDPYSSYRPSITEEYRYVPARPRFELEIDIPAPPIAPYGVAVPYPPARGYRYGYGPAYGPRDYFYRGYAVPPVPVAPLGGLRIDIPIGPLGPFGIGF
ncbi:hypothetical protein Pan14r_12780 [Crateriforma conspicua]|uniref:Uncharacterized protein n=1 Tax=Crateriforma conspicua TaxID=2527996 RepID=A0A5C5Y1A7_9PLAN|nr:hypothetical protein Pan14r_12780 [Crateriforma conspicua]